MITADGRVFIKRYFANRAGVVIGALSVGIGNKAPALNDERMQFEFFRVPVTLVDYDQVQDRLIVKATLPENVAGKIYEVGLWTSEVNSAAGNSGSRLITEFGAEEAWTNGTLDTTNYRIGAEALKHTPAANGNVSSLMTDLTMDLLSYSSNDFFNVAYEVQNGNTASIEIRFRTDSNNYYKYTISNPTTGYKFESLLKGAATAVGAPDWGTISEVEIITTSKSSGSSSVIFDGIRLEDADTVSSDYGLIARTALGQPIIKQEGIVQDVEYALSVSI